ncbi:MAG TPA: trypsin-like peptidase domain-containing protein [Nitrososphaeraceae archaeon]|jgi:S1-C subfamily serine protease
MMNRNTQTVMILTLLVISGIATVVLISHYKEAEAQTQASENQTDGQINKAVLQQSPSALVDIFKRVENSVVQVTTTRSDPNQLVIINGVPSTGRNTALGSGFVLDKQGHILTNNHVVDGAPKADITFVDGNTYSAKVVGRDPSGDLAVLQITDNFSDEKLLPLPIVNSSGVQVGEQLIAIGNPFGLSASMTTGIVSQIGRLLPDSQTSYAIPNTIQTDAAINPGNSGGPLLNMKGQVIGMNTAIFSSTGAYSGVGFAIPSESIIRELPMLIKTGTYEHPWLGLAGGKIPTNLIRNMGLSPNSKGVFVTSVQDGGPAAKAGLKGMIQDDNGAITNIGDIITAIDNQPVRQIDDIINYIEQHKKIGDDVKLTVERSGTTMDLSVHLEQRPTAQASSISQDSSSRPQLPFGLGPMPQLPKIPGFPDLKLPPLLP